MIALAVILIIVVALISLAIFALIGFCIGMAIGNLFAGEETFAEVDNDSR